MAELAPTEITALARIIDELDYYQLLHLETAASPAEIKSAYHATSRAFHPDGNRHHDPQVRLAIEAIAKRVSEAYSVLRHPRRREAYDHQRDLGGAARMRLAEAEAVGGRRETEAREGRTPQGRQFFNLALQDIARKNFDGAIRNLQTALTFEPGNEHFKQQLSEAREQQNSTRS